MRMHLSRRKFMAAGIAVTGLRALGASERVRVGFVGVGGRGTRHLQLVLGVPDVEVTAVCDIDEGRLARAAGRVREATGKKPVAYRDYKELLAAEDVDAVVNATPPDCHAAP